MTFPPPSLAALTILDAGPFGQIRAAAEAGWPSVGLRLMPLLDTDHRIVGDRAAEAALEIALEETGIDVLEIGVFPVKPTMDWPTIEAVTAFSGRIGAQHLVCPVEDSDHDRRIESFRRLCDLAATEGMTALIEFNPYSACRTLAEAVAIAIEADRDNAALVIDALHLSRSGGHPDDLAAVPAHLLRLVHLCDAPPPPTADRTIAELRAESRTARLLPGEGALWLDALLDHLPQNVGLSIEAPSAAHVHLSPTERARMALTATEAWLKRHAAVTRG